MPTVVNSDKVPTVLNGSLKLETSKFGELAIELNVFLVGNKSATVMGWVVPGVEYKPTSRDIIVGNSSTSLDRCCWVAGTVSDELWLDVDVLGTVWGILCDITVDNSSTSLDRCCWVAATVTNELWLDVDALGTVWGWVVSEVVLTPILFDITVDNSSISFDGCCWVAGTVTDELWLDVDVLGTVWGWVVSEVVLKPLYITVDNSSISFDGCCWAAGTVSDELWLDVDVLGTVWGWVVSEVVLKPILCDIDLDKVSIVSFGEREMYVEFGLTLDLVCVITAPVSTVLGGVVLYIESKPISWCDIDVDNFPISLVGCCWVEDTAEI